MSVTFWMPDAPRELKRTPCGCTKNDRCGYCQDGWEETWISDAPELNLTNSNARLVLEAIGMPSGEDLYGSFEVKHIPAVRRQIVRALNHQLPSRSVAIDKMLNYVDAVQNGANRARFIDCSITESGIRDRLVRLDAILHYAQQHNYRITWG